ncbi:MAG: DEAD/DEAH box helicase [Alphaproteobacteria bacterium]|nr:MAG: DEAD/DEAH box helicase [Alphaproteobacteria bacterium]
MQDFNFPGIPSELKVSLTRLRFTEPTPVQRETIPLALAGRDVLATAQTGTGKTAAFGIPLVTKVLSDTQSHGLVLLPTRELALQVYQAFQSFIGKAKVPMALLVGGECYTRQGNQLRANPRIVIGTPGRINDHLNRKTLSLANTRILVLDEVDRMLDMGFSIQLDAIAKFLPEVRQTLMFSATLPSGIQKLSAKYLTDPARITVGSVHTPAANIKQTRLKVEDPDKYNLLLEELEVRQGSVIVFVKTKRSADAMMVKLKKNGHKADALHGDLRQNKRNRVIADFRKQTSRVLVATDVAARGLDIPHISHVINYNLPQNPEDYIHRIGRTARAGASGEAVNFLSSAETVQWRAIERLLDPSLKDTKPVKPGSRKGRPGFLQGKGPDRRGERSSARPGAPKALRPFRAKSSSADGSADSHERRPARTFGGQSRGRDASERRLSPNGSPKRPNFRSGSRPEGRPPRAKARSAPRPAPAR